MNSAVEPYETNWQEWHSARERALATPHGWLSLTSFHWLPDVPSALDGLPGRFHSAHGHAVLQASADDGYRVRGEDEDVPVDGVVKAEVAEAGSLEWLTLGDVAIELALRGGRYAVRTRDPQAPALRGFAGVPTFPLDEAWRISGHFDPFTEPRTIRVSTARADLVQDVVGVGTVTIRPGGAPVTLIATAGAGGTLNIPFHDLTNGAITASWRTVTTAAPDSDGRVQVDFNRAVNFPFAFSDFGTCPAPPAGNALSLAVTAGERKPVAR
ncbi:hypothetical protein SAMN04515671_2388 [Nakamurella panacisegetis]|uniref:DUF1684 domain-containing protein n=1 Tax=Nakamurella panacisegetis TaxID=1090615 RepID=A0A1H0NKL3_9ACTN|nr:DUF1684 domain-containing protein [Nakamurella panacisegetis]SDO92955.1 hypothetical protein SAMN04515671_2388 [Nakamurella panacisegetis]